MKALSVQQPHAWLVVNGYKDIENRTWPLPKTFEVPQRIYIHTGKKPDKWAYRPGSDLNISLIEKLMFIPGSLAKWYFAAEEGLPLGAIVGEVTIMGLVWPQVLGGRQIMAWRNSKWYEGDFGFALEDAVAYDDPIPCKGRQGFWTPPEMEVTDG